MAENPNTRLSSVPLNYPPKIIPSSSQTLKNHSLQFASYRNAIDISPGSRILCEIIANSSPKEVEAALNSSGIRPSQELVQEVLKLSYGSPDTAVKFFRWAGGGQKLSEYSWNLMVDLLGKNKKFEPMWDAIRSMKQEGLLSIATFVSVFGSYCTSGRISEAFMTFDVMEKYGVLPDVIAVNSLLSAICREDNQTAKALEFLEKTKAKIPPDADSFAILLEGWEKEGNVAKAKTTFGEMVVRVGWNPDNISAYDAFLTTLVRGSQADEAINFLKVMKKKNCLPGLKFFSNALDVLVKQDDSAHAIPLWNIMVDSGLIPNLIMYNAMIGLLCTKDEITYAYQFLDEMPLNAAFPDSLTYNMIFQCLIKNKKVREASKFFIEMIKNECPPTHQNCASAISMSLDGEDPETAIEIWDYMLKNGIKPLDDSSNALLLGFCSMSRLTELRKFADIILDQRILIRESTMAKMKNEFYKKGRGAIDSYDSLSRRWKSF